MHYNRHASVRQKSTLKDSLYPIVSNSSDIKQLFNLSDQKYLFYYKNLSFKSDGACATMDKLLRVTCLGFTTVLLYLSSWCGIWHGQFPRVCVGNATKVNATCCPTPPGSLICLLTLQEKHLLLTSWQMVLIFCVWENSFSRALDRKFWLGFKQFFSWTNIHWRIWIGARPLSLIFFSFSCNFRQNYVK